MQCNAELKFMFWNAQGINSYTKKLQLQHILNDKNIDILFLSETFLVEGSRFSLPGYRIYRCDRASPGGGVAIVVRSFLDTSQLPTYRTANVENVSIELRLRDRTISLTAVYSPRYNDHFKEDIRKITSNNKEFIICGDLNAKHRSWNCLRANTSGNVLFNMQLSSNFFIYHPVGPTRYPQSTNGSPSTIDLLLTNSNLFISPLLTHEGILPSDHVPISFTLNAQSQHCTLTRIDFRNANWTQFRNNIECLLSVPNIELNTLTTTEQVENAITKLIGIINTAKALLPKRRFKPAQINMSHNTLLCIGTRNMLRRKFQRETNTATKALLMSIHRQANKLVDINIVNDNNKHWSRVLSKLPKCSKRFFQITKAFKGKSPSSVTSLRHNGETILGDEDKARLIANHFEKAHTLTANTTHSNDRVVSRRIRQLSFANLFSIDPDDLVTEIEIETHIRNLRNNKSPGFDGIPNILLKKLPSKAIKFLSNIFNACLKLALFPSHFKRAKVIAIPKHGKDPREACNYRPISLLSSLDKIFEKVILTRINNFAFEKDLINNEQFGFRPQHSTIHQIRRLTDIIRHNKRHRQTTGIIMLDVEKAFDSIWHDGLIYKLDKYGFPLYLIRIIQSFLTDRTFQVSLNNSISSSRNIPAGLPQGAVLSPILYSLYVSDFVPRKGSQIALYADDKALIVKGKSSNCVVKRLDNCLRTCMQYYRKWKIKINVNKTQAILFPFNKSYRRIPSLQLRNDNHVIPFNDWIKYLGVVIDKKLTFQRHIEYAANKALKYFRSLYPLLCKKSRLNTDNKLIIYRAIIRPTMIYGCPVWGNAAVSHIRKLQLIQNRALKTIFKLPRLYRTYHLHTNYCQMMILDLINTQNLKFFDKCRISDYELIRRLADDTI